MQVDQQALEFVRNQVGAIMLGSVFLFVGASALAISSVRHRKSIRILTWFGLFSACYGLRLLVEARAFATLLPTPIATARPYLIAVITYVILIPALLVWFDLTTGGIRKLVKILIGVTVVVAILGIGAAFTGKPNLFLNVNGALAIVFTLLITLVNVIPSLAKRYLIIQSRVLTAGSLVLAVAALQVNLATFLPIRRLGNLEPVAFGIFVLAIGYVAVERVMINERRLLAIDQELSIAREIQNSILPSQTPQVSGLRIAAAYYPMTSVAGDFYEFVPIDDRRAGFLIADVSGHGVPAALIASMIKVAMHAVQSSATNPGELLRGLNRILSPQLKGQFVTAGFLLIDLEANIARYSGAGHPPLMKWNSESRTLERIESNGLLFGVLGEAEYPTVDFAIRAGDRFLLYTDGLTEPENLGGEAFGDSRIADLIGQSQNHPAAGLSAILFEQMSRWQPPNTSQQDDVTLIVIDVL
jgi:sigma-B regulation protein RsbU (phosphoserine phosphatase)